MGGWQDYMLIQRIAIYHVSENRIENTTLQLEFTDKLMNRPVIGISWGTKMIAVLGRAHIHFIKYDKLKAKNGLRELGEDSLNQYT